MLQQIQIGSGRDIALGALTLSFSTANIILLCPAQGNGKAREWNLKSLLLNSRP